MGQVWVGNCARVGMYWGKRVRLLHSCVQRSLHSVVHLRCV